MKIHTNDKPTILSEGREITIVATELEIIRFLTEWLGIKEQIPLPIAAFRTAVILVGVHHMDDKQRSAVLKNNPFVGALFLELSRLGATRPLEMEQAMQEALTRKFMEMQQLNDDDNDLGPSRG